MPAWPTAAGLLRSLSAHGRDRDPSPSCRDDLRPAGTRSRSPVQRGRRMGMLEGQVEFVIGVDTHRDSTPPRPATRPAIIDPDAVDHERDQVQAGQVGGQQLGQGVLGRATNRCETADLEVPSLPARPGDRRAPTRDDTGDRRARPAPLQAELVQQLGRGEHLPGRQGQLGGAVGAAHPRPVDRSLSPRTGALEVSAGPPRRAAALLARNLLGSGVEGGRRLGSPP